MPEGTGNPSPEQLLGTKHANIGDIRASLHEQVPLDVRLNSQKLKRRHLDVDEKKLANQHLNDLAALKNGDQSAAQRLSNYRPHFYVMMGVLVLILLKKIQEHRI